MGLTTLKGQLVSKSEIVESCHGMLNCYALTFAPFFKKFTFLRLRYFISPCTDPINQIFPVVVKSIRFKFLMKLFFLVGAVAMITEKLCFSYFHGNHCQRNRFVLENNAAYQSKLSLKKWSKQIKNSQENVS